MDNKTIEIGGVPIEPSEIYKNEWYYQKLLHRQGKDVSELHSHFPEEDEEARRFIRSAWREAAQTDPSYILYPPKVKE